MWRLLNLYYDRLAGPPGEQPPLLGASFRGANLRGTRFAHSVLIASDFRGAIFNSDTQLDGANVLLANFEGVTAEILSCEQFYKARNWAFTFRDKNYCPVVAAAQRGLLADSWKRAPLNHINPQALKGAYYKFEQSVTKDCPK
jgi:uncharacterized protein YjbI with pentapeptide repeats